MRWYKCNYLLKSICMEAHSLIAEIMVKLKVLIESNGPENKQILN